MKHGCDNCKYRFFPVTRSPCDNCAMSGNKYSEWTALTNADRIRAMSDKDLADLLSGGEPYPWCEQDPCPAETCQECIIMWLNQEAKE